MRVLFVQPTADKKGHYGIYTTKLCQELALAGHDVTLWTNKIYPERYIKKPPLFKIIEVANGKYRFEKFDENRNKFSLYYYFGYFKNSFLILKSALELIKKQKFDLIHITGVEFLITSFLLKKFKKNLPPVVIEMSAANFSYSTYPGSLLAKFYKLIQREILKTTLGRELKAIAVLGEWHKEKLRGQLSLNNQFPIAVIPDGGEEPKQPIDKAKARLKIGLNYKDPVFLFFGLLRKDKGIDCLLEAVSYLKSEEFKLLIAGAPYDYKESEIETRIKKLGIEDKVIKNLKYIPDEEVSYYFFACDALILPYPKIYTGGSGPLLKGAAVHQRPSIVTNVSEMGRLAREYNIGLIAEPENPQSLAEKIKEFLSLSEIERKGMAKNAFNLAQANSWQAMAKKYTELYEKISK